VVATADWINHAILSYEEASAGVRALARRGLLVERAHGVLVLSLAARNGFAAAYGTRKRMGVFKLWDVADALIARQAHAREIGEHVYDGPDSPFSPDWFLYVRSCIVANGRSTFEQVLADPKEMLKDLELEALLYVASKAYARKTGKEFTYVPSTSYETFSNDAGWKA
jgi:hypothetical protein